MKLGHSQKNKKFFQLLQLDETWSSQKNKKFSKFQQLDFKDREYLLLWVHIVFIW
jgi:hypothetical protein